MSIKELVEKTVENVAIVTDRDFPVGCKGNTVQLNESKTQAYELGQDSWHRDGHLVDFKSYFKDMDVSDNGYIRVQKLDLGVADISVDLVIKAYSVIRREIFEFVNSEYDAFVEKYTGNAEQVEEEGEDFKIKTFRIIYGNFTDLGKEYQDELEDLVVALKDESIQLKDDDRVTLENAFVMLFKRMLTWEEVSKMVQRELDDLKRYAEVNAK